MKWNLTLIAIVVLTGVFVLRAETTLPEAQAREKLKQGAVVIDVRTVEEYHARHLTNVVHIPLDQVKEGVTKKYPDKSKVLLLHCRSGRRSGIAEKEVRSLGYTNAFNIGSYEQAERVVNPPAK
jgi:phage shock protein E